MIRNVSGNSLICDHYTAYTHIPFFEDFFFERRKINVFFFSILEIKEFICLHALLQQSIAERTLLQRKLLNALKEFFCSGIPKQTVILGQFFHMCKVFLAKNNIDCNYSLKLTKMCSWKSFAVIFY